MSNIFTSTKPICKFYWKCQDIKNLQQENIELAEENRRVNYELNMAQNIADNLRWDLAELHEKCPASLLEEKEKSNGDT